MPRIPDFAQKVSLVLIRVTILAGVGTLLLEQRGNEVLVRAIHPSKGCGNACAVATEEEH